MARADGRGSVAPLHAHALPPGLRLGPDAVGLGAMAEAGGAPEIIQRNEDKQSDALFVSIITLVEGVAGLLLAVIALVVGESDAPVARTAFPSLEHAASARAALSQSCS